MPIKLLATSLRYFFIIWLLCSFGVVNARDANFEFTIPTIAATELPSEARITLKLILDGGPFPYRRDGIEFQNRESRLPRKPRNYYREYTVRTPGTSSRGARRIIAGSSKEFYYTADHYRSFRRITP